MNHVDEIIRRCIRDGDLVVDVHNGKVYNARHEGICEVMSELSGKGYLRFRFRKDGRIWHFRVHRVVYIAAYGSIPEGLTIDHINNVKTDNRVCNLQPMTNLENTRKYWDGWRARREALRLEDKESENERIVGI